MSTGVLDEIELQSKRVIEQKKQEVAQLAQYQDSLQKSIDEHNVTLSTLQQEKSKLEALIKSLKDNEASQQAKITSWEQEAKNRLNAQKAVLADQAASQDQRAESLAEGEKELARQTKNLESEVEKIKVALSQHLLETQDLVNGLLLDLG